MAAPTSYALDVQKVTHLPFKISVGERERGKESVGVRVRERERVCWSESEGERVLE